MPCQLKKDQSSAADFEGPATKKVKLSVRATGGDPSAVELDFVRYDGKTIHSDPAEIAIAAGAKPLIVGLRGLVDGQIGHLVELCGDGTEQQLRRLRFNAMDPAKIYVLEGK